MVCGSMTDVKFKVTPTVLWKQTSTSKPLTKSVISQGARRPSCRRLSQSGKTLGTPDGKCLQATPLFSAETFAVNQIGHHFFFYGFAMKLGLVEFNHQTPPMRFAILRLEGLVGDQGGNCCVFAAFSPSKTGWVDFFSGKSMEILAMMEANLQLMMHGFVFVREWSVALHGKVSSQ